MTAEPLIEVVPGVWIDPVELNQIRVDDIQMLPFGIPSFILYAELISYPFALEIVFSRESAAIKKQKEINAAIKRIKKAQRTQAGTKAVGKRAAKAKPADPE